MLRDEVPRTQVLLYFFDEVAGARAGLETLAQRAFEMAVKGIKVMAISEAPLEELTQVQQRLSLPFPLLHDDRGFSTMYGAGTGNPAALVLVGRDRRVVWVGRGQVDFAASVVSLITDHSRVRDATSNYPRRVINRLVDRWVN
jgi:peroxiredoxin